MHAHEPIDVITRPYNGAVSHTENRAAHGGICDVERCECGAERRTNRNGYHEERGSWRALGVEFRAYDVTTEWSGPARTDYDAAVGDAHGHNRRCSAQGGYGSAIVALRDPAAPSRLMDADGAPIWPPHGRGTGAARWRDAVRS